MRSLTTVCLTTLLMLGACDGSGAKAVKIDKYFDLVSLLDQQAELLYNSGARLEKVLVANGKEDKMMVRPDSLGQLKAELKLFYEADINKLGLDDAYYEEELPGINGSRKVINTAKKKAPNVRLIEYDYEQDQLRHIRILVQDKNDIYNLEKEMLLNFEQVNGRELLTSYSINGKQDMVMKSELEFSLSGKVLLNP